MYLHRREYTRHCGIICDRLNVLEYCGILMGFSPGLPFPIWNITKEQPPIFHNYFCGILIQQCFQCRNDLEHIRFYFRCMQMVKMWWFRKKRSRVVIFPMLCFCQKTMTQHGDETLLFTVCRRKQVVSSHFYFKCP